MNISLNEDVIVITVKKKYKSSERDRLTQTNFLRESLKVKIHNF